MIFKTFLAIGVLCLFIKWPGLLLVVAWFIIEPLIAKMLEGRHCHDKHHCG